MLLASPPVASRAGRALALAAMSVCLFAGCDSPVAPRQANPAPRAPSLAAQVRPERPAPPRLMVQTPRYPAPVLYILYREYLYRNPGLTSLSPEDPRYQQYLERRLRQLYPGRGYAGMVRDAVEERKRQTEVWNSYQRKVREWETTAGIMACTGTMLMDPETGEPCQPSNPDPTPEPDPGTDPSWDGNEEFQVPPDETIPTLVMEIDTLQMMQPEIDQMYYQESLADGSYQFRRDELIVASTSTGAPARTIDDLIVMAGEGRMPGQLTASGIDEQDVAQATLSLAVIGWKAWRVVQSVKRARQKSDEYFGALPYSNSKRDACRHIFWNMQMNRYVGGALAGSIASTYELLKPNPAPGREMDVHNNAIGREVRYRSFRGHWLWDRWDWQEWAEKVRNYINRSGNAEYIPEWQNESAVTSQAAAQRAGLVPNWKYIYFLP